MPRASTVIRCPQCRTRRKDAHLMFLHELGCKRPLCQCGGYHYKHRPGSPYCHQNPLSPIAEAHRQGNPEHVIVELAARIVMEHPHLAERVQFECGQRGISAEDLVVDDALADCPF